MTWILDYTITEICAPQFHNAASKTQYKTDMIIIQITFTSNSKLFTFSIIHKTMICGWGGWVVPIGWLQHCIAVSCLSLSESVILNESEREAQQPEAAAGFSWHFYWPTLLYKETQNRFPYLPQFKSTAPPCGGRRCAELCVIYSLGCYNILTGVCCLLSFASVCSFTHLQ